MSFSVSVGDDDYDEIDESFKESRLPAEERVIKRYFAEKPPSVLYHYTRQTSFRSILESQELWFTDIEYFNDSQEYSYALRMAEEEIESIRKLDPSPINRHLAESILYDLKNSGLRSYYVFCCSQKGDLLSQWRSYAAPGPGYAIGFDSTFLTGLVDGVGKLGCCIYKRDVQRAFVADFVGAFFSSLADYFPYFKDGEINGDLFFAGKIRFLELFYHQAPFIKNESFAEESEWRLVIPAKHFAPKAVKFRDGRVAMIPYVSMSREELSLRRHVKSVIVKPNPHGELACSSVRRYFESKGLDDIPLEVRLSAIPFREEF